MELKIQHFKASLNPKQTQLMILDIFDVVILTFGTFHPFA